MEKNKPIGKVILKTKILRYKFFYLKLLLMDCYIVYYLIGLFHLINKTHQQFVNLAYGKSARISTRYNDNYFAPGKAVDGDTSTYPLDCTLSASGQKEAWLQVDLGEKKNIASISFIHGGLGWNAKSISSQHSGISADSDGTGTVYQRDGRALCMERFSFYNTKVICLIWGFLPDSTQFGGTISDEISSQYIRCQGNETSINQCSSGICTRNRAVTVACEKGNALAGFSVYVSDTQNWTTGSICYEHDIQEIPNTNNINISCVTSGRYVTIYNTRNQTSYTGVSDNAYINICEIDVQGCETGFYGPNCTKCPENCLSGSCQFQIGYCFECEDGYMGEICESECDAGLYGQNCSLTCGDCRDEAACNNVNGSCSDGCFAGRRGDKCDLDCEYGYFGYNCSNTCYLPNRRNSTSCNTISGECLVGCVEGWTGKTCNDYEYGYSGYNRNNTSYLPNYRKSTYCESNIEECFFSCVVGWADKTCIVTSTNTNSLLIAVVVVSAILILTMISIALYCIKRNYRCVEHNNRESEYENTVITDENNEYNQLQLKKESDSVESETTNYMDISTIDVVSNTEYINLSFK